MKGNFHAVVNNTWYSILFDHKLAKLFSTEIFFKCKACWEGSYYNYNIVFELLLTFLFIFSAVSFLTLIAQGEGCADPFKTANTCGYSVLKVQGVDKSPHGRGHNIVVLDGTTGT